AGCAPTTPPAFPSGNGVTTDCRLAGAAQRAQHRRHPEHAHETGTAPPFRAFGFSFYGGMSMSNAVIEHLKKRRTVNMDKDALNNLIQQAIKHTPSSFNSQSSRAVILFGEQSVKFWALAKE